MSHSQPSTGEPTRTVKVRVNIDGPLALRETLRRAFEESRAAIERIEPVRRTRRRPTDQGFEARDRPLTLEYHGPAEAFLDLVDRPARLLVQSE